MTNSTDRKTIKEYQCLETYQILDTDLDTAISTLEALRRAAGGDAILAADIGESYGDYYIDLALNWNRPETDGEYDKRQATNAKRAESARKSTLERKKQDEKAELALYKKLKAKYDD